MSCAFCLEMSFLFWRRQPLSKRERVFALSDLVSIHLARKGYSESEKFPL